MGRVKSRFEHNVFDVLMIEHRDVEALFDQIDALQPEAVQAAQDLFTVLHDSLLAHAKAEQQAVYPRFAKIRELADLVAEATAEHEAVEMLLEEVRALDPGSEAWQARLAVLRENVKHHVKEEEYEVFPTAREKLHDSEALELAADYLRAKSRITGEPEAEQARDRTPPKRGIVARIASLFR